jgi:hypothetical protein
MASVKTSLTPTRRTLLAGAAATPVLALPAVALAAAQEPDPFPALESAFWRYYRWEDLPRGMADDDPRKALYMESWLETADRIIATPATTVAGLRTKVRVLILEMTDGQSEYGEDLAESLLADLDRLAGSAAA